MSKEKIKELEDMINKLSEERDNFEIISNSHKELSSQLRKELDEVKLDNIRLAKQVEHQLKGFHLLL